MCYARLPSETIWLVAAFSDLPATAGESRLPTRSGYLAAFHNLGGERAGRNRVAWGFYLCERIERRNVEHQDDPHRVRETRGQAKAGVDATLSAIFACRASRKPVPGHIATLRAAGLSIHRLSVYHSVGEMKHLVSPTPGDDTASKPKAAIEA